MPLTWALKLSASGRGAASRSPMIKGLECPCAARMNSKEGRGDEAKVEADEQRSRAEPSARVHLVARSPLGISSTAVFFVPECRSQNLRSLDTDPTIPLRAAKNSASVPFPMCWRRWK